MEKFCEQCGEQLETDSKFCGKCGARIFEISDDQSSSNTKNHLNKANKKIKSKKKKKSIGKTIVSIMLILLLLFVLFISAVIFFVKSTDASLDASKFSGYYSGELWITEITIEGNEKDISEYMSTIKDIKMPMAVEIKEDKTYDGNFIVKDSNTLEDEQLFIFNGEYDQFIGDTELEDGMILSLEGIVDIDKEPIIIDGFIDVVNDEFINIVAEYHIEKVEKLIPIDSLESTNAVNEALKDYFDKTLVNDLEEQDSNDSSLIEDENLIPDEGLFSLNQDTLTGVWELDDGYEGTFIIFDKGEYYDSFSEWTYIWDNEGYALFYLDEDVEVVPYEIQANKVMIHYERYGNESECYIKHNDISHQLIFNPFDENTDSNTMIDDYSDVQIIEKDIPSNMNKELIFAIEAEVDEDSKTLNGILYVDFIDGNIVELKLNGSKVE
ncbi:zinc ribbon domain-containing protein [Clostridiaceae bacterium HSG29]|nr:zinc ribbon domain-containing protein [Clostridiaceae bacterium HSG29]